MTESGQTANTRQSLTVFPTKSRLGIYDYIRLGILALILGSIFFIYNFFGVTDIGYDINRITHSAFFWLFDRWRMDWRDTWFAHSHWVPLVSLLLIWLDRRALAVTPKKTNYVGLLLIVLSLLVHWAGAKSEQTRLTIISLIGLSWSIPLFICGWPTAKRLLFPCGFLLFSLPLNFFDSATYPLRIMAAAVTSGILSGLGIEVTRIGSAILNDSPSFNMELADSRSSIFAVTAIVAYSLVCVHMIRARCVTKTLIVLAAIPLLVISNIMRGVTVMLLASAFGGNVGRIAYTYLSGPLILLSFAAITLWCIKKNQGRTEQIIESTASAAAKHAPVKAAWYMALAALLLGAAWIPNNLDVIYVDEAGVNLNPPHSIGQWTGGPILFCHNPTNRIPYADASLSAGDPCPDCGQPLYMMSAIEKQLLPADTILKKHRYEDANENPVFFTIVLSGQKRSSIHRPEVCLVGPNSEIDHSFIHTVDLGNGKTLDVKILDMVHRGQNPDGTMAVWTSYYAYWFAGVNRETPYHLQRMLWMASDRLFRNKSLRWAYISVSGSRNPKNTRYLGEVDDFIRSVYPHLHE